MASTPTTTTTTTQRSRQLPGLACDECRRRKLRCDRVQPQCGVCRDSATTCVTTTTRQPRGPKRGHLRVLQSRIVALERRLSSDRTSEDTTDDDFTRLPDELDTTFATPDQQAFSDLIPQDARDFFEKEASSSDLAHNFEVDSVFSQLNSAMALPITRLSPVDFISEPMRSDLSHLYFDRVHSFFPILNKRHYFVRARRSHYEQEDEAFPCLQHAMWTLAVSTSSQFQHIQDDLYTHTSRMIENLEQRYLNAECMRLEQVQARALLTIYEFMRVGYRKAWMSAGKCFRFAMLMKLHNIDGRDGVASLLLQNLTFVEIEERRRTFWMAYTIDRIISLLDRLPVTFDQHTILTRLPCPEKEFQSDEPTVMDFLPSPLLVSESKIPSTFTDSIQLVAICGQLLSHQQQGVVEHAQGLISLGFWDRQQQLDARLEQAIQGMALDDPYALIFQDPMAYFTVLAAQASSLMLFKSSQIAPWGTNESNDVAVECEKRAMAAAHQMIMMSKALVELSYFKIHPFTPVLLHFCGDFLISNPHLDPTFEMRLTLQTVLQALSPVNVIAQECVDRLRIVD
ncbi:hypothetical protein COCMIDRAFT_109926 [Bipolaris oryzae ATCC 44560]|uniref:Zn(2)-C6 fungal-type domain-containing protein n=1 Tax=Bipolaris oryzae ATCC 44560 TaxID=930090 RepID=W6Z8I7_COCMI|nr:uncharacterized protein COCMIDRAFT_109926 [Bipolaris oryzae ATCC 44560]EUC40001.1 hypothetical protein COCMIDRAFT_109926 [Bipolaris oryzae ATCC 44560]